MLGKVKDIRKHSSFLQNQEPKDPSLSCFSLTLSMIIDPLLLSFIIERREGLLDRSWIAGVTSLEVSANDRA